MTDDCVLRTGFLVGPGGIEPPTSPLSGVRSSQLSYRPKADTGGAGRDRTGDLLNANQALSQLSYSPRISSGQWRVPSGQRMKLATGHQPLATDFCYRGRLNA